MQLSACRPYVAVEWAHSATVSIDASIGFPADAAAFMIRVAASYPIASAPAR